MPVDAKGSELRTLKIRGIVMGLQIIGLLVVAGLIFLGLRSLVIKKINKNKSGKV